MTRHAVTTSLPAVRMLHDALGPAGAAAVLRRLRIQGPTFRIPGPHAAEGWEEAMTGADSWRMAGDHLHATTRLAPGVTVDDGMLIAPPGSLPVETLASLAPGRPLRFVVDHPALDDGMVVTAIGTGGRTQCWVSFDGGRIAIDAALSALGSGRRP